MPDQDTPGASVAPVPWTYDHAVAYVRDAYGEDIADVVVAGTAHDVIGPLLAAAYLLPQCMQALRDSLKRHDAFGTREIDPPCACNYCESTRQLLVQLEQAGIRPQGE